MASKLNEGAQQLLTNIKTLQENERKLYSELNNATTKSDKKIIINQISTLSGIRIDLRRSIENANAFKQSEAERTINTLESQIQAIDIMDKSLDLMSAKYNKLADVNESTIRKTEITQYYGKKYSAQISILQTIIIMCVPIILLNILMSKKIIPDNVYMTTITIILFIGTYVIMTDVVDLYQRNSNNFDEYNFG